ncbi:hypothetical protein B7P43_G12229 [Cryptotermes secundus]|uniref:Uncharacterized protein n=1 Tax=Cryptotermes secundus TaxID=105785 RepID=A0A2J7R4M9_9NEOP|nr:hypothetical protein B7P43_G12229 [Cryptotermes secundus]
MAEVNQVVATPKEEQGELTNDEADLLRKIEKLQITEEWRKIKKKKSHFETGQKDLTVEEN